MKKFTQKELRAMPAKDLSIDQFIALAKRIDPKVKLSRAKVGALGNGAFLGIYKNKEGKWYRMHLKTIWFRYFNVPYRTTKTKNGKARIGREMLIGNMPLGRGKII